MTASASFQSRQRNGPLAISIAGHEGGHHRHRWRRDVERARLDLLDEVRLLAELLGREDADRHRAVGALVDPLGELVEQVVGDFAGRVGMTEAQRLRGRRRRNGAGDQGRREEYV